MTPTLALPIVALLILVGIILVAVLAVRKRKAGGNAGKVVAIGCGVMILAPVIIVGLVAVFIRWMSPVRDSSRDAACGAGNDWDSVVQLHRWLNVNYSPMICFRRHSLTLRRVGYDAPKELVESLKSIRPMGKSLPQVALIRRLGKGQRCRFHDSSRGIKAEPAGRTNHSERPNFRSTSASESHESC